MQNTASEGQKDVVFMHLIKKDNLFLADVSRNSELDTAGLVKRIEVSYL